MVQTGNTPWQLLLSSAFELKRAELYMRSLPLFPAVAICLFWFSSGSTVQCQEPERIHSVFTSDARFGYLISPGLKLNSVFNKLTSELELYGGLLINEKKVLGAAAGINVGYPDINYKYIGIIAQYIYISLKTLFITVGRR